MHPIANIRKDYMLQTLEEAQVLPNPIQQFDLWWKQTIASEIMEPNAMTICTTDINGKPQGRIVLLKGYDEHGFVFFTNYHSHKGGQLAAAPYATLVFFWKELERQVRISGNVVKVSDQESDDYFASRPIKSQIGAWVSEQSRLVETRNVLETRMEALEDQYAHEQVPRPPHWGGYRVVPESLEFWQGRHSRLHDRILYTKELHNWKIQRLAP